MFNFGEIVIVEKNLVGVIVKCWTSQKGDNYDIYVRSYNAISNYSENEIHKFIYDKELTDEQLEFYNE